MTRRANDKAALVGLLVAIASLVAMLVGAGMYVGKLEQRITTLERIQDFEHGDVTPFLARGPK